MKRPACSLVGLMRKLHEASGMSGTDDALDSLAVNLIEGRDTNDARHFVDRVDDILGDLEDALDRILTSAAASEGPDRG